MPKCEPVAIPGVDNAFSLHLPDDMWALRDKTLKQQRDWSLNVSTYGNALSSITDAEAWAAHTPDEDWLIWRARRAVARMHAMPLIIDSGDIIVGKPRHVAATEADKPVLEEAEKILSVLPPYAGGDCGHFHPDYEKLFRLGIGGIIAEIDRLSQRPGLNDEQKIFYRSCRMAMEGMTDFCNRIAGECDAMAEREPQNVERWNELAAMCRRLSTQKPATFHEAIQLMFIALIALWFADDHGLTTPGRMDQTLRPFYEADIAAGRITPRRAFELISCLYIHLNHILVAGSAESVMVGGRDKHGRDVTNPLTYLCLAARQATQLVYPTVGVAWHEKTPGELMDYCVRMLAAGIGDPAFFNDELISLALRDHGVSEADSYNYMNSTCVEIKVCGASHMWVTCPYYNCPKAMTDVMGEVADGKSPRPETYEEFNGLVRKNLSEQLSKTAAYLDKVWKQRAIQGCFPLASCLISDCLERGKDFDRGGARYNWVENSFVGLANLTDGTLAIKHFVYDKKEVTIEEFYEIIKSDYEGREEFRHRILNEVPKYGNDNDEVDNIAKEWAEFLISETEKNVVGLHRYVPGFFCWIVHEAFGRETCATPDGRKAGLPFADGAGAAQGREKNGPTASVLSTTKWSHRKALGGLVHNAKFTKSVLKDDRDRRALRDVIETYMRRGGFEMQINVVGKDRLIEAQKTPEQYLDLLVRVAGYSDYFVHLNPKMQQEVIDRTEFSHI